MLARSPLTELVQDAFVFGAARQTLTRQYLRHKSAVGILAVNDADQILLVRQYRHPVRAHLWEIPTGLLDSEGESMLQTAQRELAEEADLSAESWHTLVDFFTTPGISDEAMRVYLARDLHAVPMNERHIREDEEAEFEFAWITFEEALQAVMSGVIRNPATVTGLLALHAVRTGAGKLRDPTSPWPLHPRSISP